MAKAKNPRDLTDKDLNPLRRKVKALEALCQSLQTRVTILEIIPSPSQDKAAAQPQGVQRLPEGESL